MNKEVATSTYAKALTYEQHLERLLAVANCKLRIEEQLVAYWKDLYTKLYEKTELGEIYK